VRHGEKRRNYGAIELWKCLSFLDFQISVLEIKIDIGAMLTQSEGDGMGKKLIEVALPLEAINREAARENYIYKGNPSAIHKWWAQRPLAACRAVLFASLVDDPSSHPELFPTEETQERERQRLFRLIEDLVKWENSNNEKVLERVRGEVHRSCGDNPPP